MENFKQFIVTRFNIKLFFNKDEQYFELDKRKLSTQTDEWLEERFDIFENYCFPSVKGQTNQNFKWICLFDVDTPDKYKKKIESYVNEYPNFVPHFIEPTLSDDLYLQVDTAIRSNLDKNDKFIISTNLDNDDVVHKNLAKEIEDRFKKNPRNILFRFVYGYQYFAKKKYLLKMRYPHNHFLTLVREINEEPIKDITHYYHARAHKIMDYEDVITHPLWIEVVHATNVNNDFRVNGRIRYTPIVKSKNLLNDFNIDIKTKKGANFVNTLTYLPGLFFGTVGRKLKRKIFKESN